uniref:Uncharacterized protein n=1 Tax=Eucampia antarctica TaxID=49252 RepID=A0A7S2WNJ1_9STRA|mmetsp:Transcript_7836/g.7407  ORF Transcript_7836/g.7407 Transcript_7836/m.7407 type:complete len:216 (+) Transcript_7836:88-735(+)
MCLLCFSTDKVAKDDMKGKYGAAFGPYADSEETFKITMCEAPCQESCCYVGSLFCGCFAHMKMRHKALNHLNPGSGWDDYKCCQGYFGGCCCLQPGEMCETTCPCPCACCETVCCPGLAVSATSMLLRDKYNLGLDDDDIRLIRCNNCLYTLACIVNILSCFCDWDGERECVQCINCVSDLVFCCVSACMTAQVNHEIEFRESQNAPSAIQMSRE